MSLSKNVSFERNLISGVAQPMSPYEAESLYWFNRHARSCVDCYQPYTVYKDKRTLCAEGLQKARKVSGLNIVRRDDGNIYRYCKKTYQYLFIEVPSEWKHVYALLKALDRSNGAFLNRYTVAPRLSSRKQPHPETMRPKSVYDDSAWTNAQDNQIKRSQSTKKHPKHPARQASVSLGDGYFNYNDGHGHVTYDSRYSQYPTYWSNGRY